MKLHRIRAGIAVVVALAGVALLQSLFGHPYFDETPSETTPSISLDAVDQYIRTTLQRTDDQTLSHGSTFHRVPRDRQVQAFHVTEPDASKPAKSRLVLMTAVFGVSPLPPYIPMFLRSIQESGADGIIIGDPDMDLKDHLPPNVKHIPLTWDGLHDLISHKLFGGTPLKRFQDAGGYKVIDVKPLYGFLFSEYIRDYEFWAHVDTDIIFGNIAEFMNPLMDQYDVISPLIRPDECEPEKPCFITYGPFTAYRNVPVITELFRLIETDLYETLNTAEFYSIDEWGHFPHDGPGPSNFSSVNYPRSMSNVIHKHWEKLSIRVGGNGRKLPLYWDGGKIKSGLCVWTTEDGRSKLMQGNRWRLIQEVAWCHFEYSKHNAAKLLWEMPKIDRDAILNATSVVWSVQNGLSVGN